MPPTDQAQPERQDTESLDHLVVERVRRDLRAGGRDLPITARLLHAVRNALYRAPLESDETAVHEALRASPNTDSVSALISMRVEAALSTALDEASKEFGDGETRTSPSVVVLRRAAGDSANRIDSQVTSALSEVKARVAHTPRTPGQPGRAGASRHIDTSRLLLLAHSAAFEKLRRRLPALLADDQKRVAFIPRKKKDDAAPPPPVSDIEIVQADAELEPLEQHIAGLLAKKGVAKHDGGDESMGFATGGTQSREKRAPDSTPDALIGTLFHHKYRIVRKIGHGGFGSVYEARDERGAGNRVAIKVLRTDLAGNRALFQSFKNEARRVTRLSHPNIVDWKVFDETEDGTQYLVMELVDGEELDRVLSREGALPPARVANILLQILDALRTAHHLAEGGSILHLDLKPRNVFLVQGKRDKSDLVKVIDFGIGQYIGGEEEEELPDLDGETPAEATSGETGFNPTTMSFHRKQEADAAEGASGDTKGTRFKRSRACTPEYASPEQCVHVLGMPEMIELDGRSDIYSLGVMGFQMLTGHLPFQRPLMRSDMLRLHMQKAPRKVGAMGVRVPRAFAKFIDRCLEKERDKRFPDTNSAWRELHRIVHPPVSHTVAKVVVPLVIIALVAIGTLWAKVGTRAAAVGLSSDLGIDLSRDVLYLGPSRPSAVVSATTAEGRAALASSANARLVLADGGAVLDGWSATRDASGQVTLAPTSPPSASLDRRVVLDVDGSGVEFQPFHLAWLAADAWSVRSIHVGSARLFDGSNPEASDKRAIDPSEQFLTLRAGGPVFGALSEVRIKIGDGDSSVLPVAQTTAQDNLYRASLSELGLVRGSNQVTFLVTDRAGRPWERVVPIEVLADHVVLKEATLIDQARSMSECNQALGRYAIYPQTRPLLHLSFDRPVDVKWWIDRDGVGEVQAPQKSIGKALHEIALDSSAPFNGASTGAGTIHVEADDGAYVVHAEGSERGREKREISFDQSAVAASITVALDDKGLRHILTEGNSPCVNRHDVALVVARQSLARIKVVVTARLEGGTESPDSVESSALKSETETSIPLRLPRDGRYSVTVDAFQYLTQADVVGDRPDVTQRYTIVVDTSAPKLQVSGLAAGGLVLPKDGHVASLQVSLLEGDKTIGSPVDVTWSLSAGEQTQALKSGEIGHDQAEPATLAFDLPDLWSGTTGLADGAYTLVLEARDVSGNSSAPVRVAFSVAAHGPHLELESPQERVMWKRTQNGDWQIELRASDPNGVDQVTCDVMKVGAPGGIQSVAMATTSTDPAGDQVWTGRVLFPETWSKAEATLRLSARDRAGVPTLDERGPFRLPEVEAARPELVSVVVPDGKAEHMRLVTGNAGFPYVFGGRGDETENRLFVQSGLGRFNEQFGATGRQISWAIAYTPGEIDDFYLDEHEVTCGQFLQFMSAKETGYADRSHWPAGSTPIDRARMTELEARLSSAPRDLPVTDVTWDEASAYAHWIGKRLPSWVEWEYAARGGQAYRPYAAAAASSAKKPEVNVLRSRSVLEPWPSGTGSDVTPDTAIANLTGNVAEWTSSADLTRGDESVDVGRRAAEHARELLRPELALNVAECTHFWAVGGTYARPLLSFFVSDSRKREYHKPALGFRCAASLADVRTKLSDGRFIAQETAGATPK